MEKGQKEPEFVRVSKIFVKWYYNRPPSQNKKNKNPYKIIQQGASAARTLDTCHRMRTRPGKQTIQCRQHGPSYCPSAPTKRRESFSASKAATHPRCSYNFGESSRTSWYRRPFVHGFYTSRRVKEARCIGRCACYISAQLF